MAAVYRLFGEHFGLALPREVIGEPYSENSGLQGVFTAPRTLPDGRPNPKYDRIRHGTRPHERPGHGP
ncbi:hypothetical protein ACWD0J_02595 [Streptomyces sp. NPDC003011]